MTQLEQVQALDAYKWTAVIRQIVRLEAVPDYIDLKYSTRKDPDDCIIDLFRLFESIENSYANKQYFWDGLMAAFQEIVPFSGINSAIANTRESEAIFYLLNIIATTRPNKTKDSDHYKTLFGYIQRNTLLGIMDWGANLHFKLLNALIPYGHRNSLENYYWHGIKADFGNNPKFYETGTRFFCHLNPDKLLEFLDKIYPRFANNKVAMHSLSPFFDYSIEHGFKLMNEFVGEIKVGEKSYEPSKQFNNTITILNTWIDNRNWLLKNNVHCQSLYKKLQLKIMEGFREYSITDYKTNFLPKKTQRIEKEFAKKTPADNART